MNSIQSENHRLGTYKINKIPLSCFVDKMFNLINGYYVLALGYCI